jgi:UDP-galactopyranose mutase
LGSGFFGSVIANLSAIALNIPVLVLEKREHIGGNSFSYDDPDTGIQIHKYGTHVFHTSNQRVWDFVNQFTSFNNFQLNVWSNSAGTTYSMPINLNTINQAFGGSFSPQEAKEMIRLDSLKNGAEFEGEPSNLREKAIQLVGVRLYELLLEGYTKKQWQTDPTQLPAEIITRLPVRYNFNNRYFSDTYEGIPVGGYGQLFKNMLTHNQIEVRTSTDFFSVRGEIRKDDLVIYTGPIDRYFNYSHGALKWRTIDLELETLPLGDFQGCALMNFADESVPYTRIHEFRHLHPEKRNLVKKTVIAKEFSRWATGNDEPYYPVNTAEDRTKLAHYRQLIKSEERVIFGGRLGSYQYLDMHMAIASAINTFENQVSPCFK